jgi:TPR repeat protein
MSDAPPVKKAPFTIYPYVFLTVAFFIGFGLFKGFGSLLSPEAAPAWLLSVTGSTGAAIGFGVLFLIGVIAVHMFFRIPVYKSELLLLQLLPAIWMLLCFDGFRSLEPKENHNSGAYLLLAGTWFFNRKDLSASLLAGRVGTWSAAALFCGTGFLAGMLLLVWFPFGWAGLPIFFLGFIAMVFVIATPEPKKAPAAEAPAPAPTPRRTALWPVVVALVAVAGLGAAYVLFSGRLTGDSLRAFLGSSEAQFRMGWRYREGEGVAQDFSIAAAYFEKAAASGSARAQYDLGILQYYGLGVPEATGRDRSRRLEQAAAQNYAPAVTMLGLIARRDEHDPGKAMELWRRGASLRDPFAEYLLGTAYLGLAPSEGNLTRALYWFEKARRSSINPVGNLLPQIWSTVPEESLDRVTAAVFQNLEKGTEP